MQYIPPLAPGNRLPSWKGTFVCTMLAGMLSMLCAEVFSGASVLWFVQPWGWLVTFPLYLAHLLFFLNLALYFRRTSLPALYFWGVLFALYESWITKVTWAGYMNQPAQANTILGFAPLEFSVIVLFWHPVMSFIVPILLFELFSRVSSSTSPILPGHSSLLAKNRRNLAMFGGIAVIGSLFLAMNAQFNVIAALVTLLGTFLFVAILWYFTGIWNNSDYSVFSLTLGKLGFGILSLYLVLLYGIAFFLLFPERIPPVFTLILTVMIYALVVLVLWKSMPAGKLLEFSDTPDPLMGIPELLKFGAGMTVLVLILCLVPNLSSSLGILVYLLLMAAGPVITGTALCQIIRNARRPSAA